MEYEELKKANKTQRYKRAKEVIITLLEMDEALFEREAELEEVREEIAKAEKLREYDIIVTFDNEEERVYADCDLLQERIRIDED